MQGGFGDPNNPNMGGQQHGQNPHGGGGPPRANYGYNNKDPNGGAPRLDMGPGGRGPASGKPCTPEPVNS